MKRSLSPVVFAFLTGVVITLTGSAGGKNEQIHSSLQAAAERAVGKQSACVIAIDPRSGQILAMVNREMVCTRAYPPGSTLKLLTAFAGLQEGVITRESTVNCRNFYKSDEAQLICSVPGGHGTVGVERAISESCSVFFYQLGERLGFERLLHYFRKFGLASVCGAYPAEQSAGSLPSRLESKSEVARFAAGQAHGLTVTPLQMAVVTCAIANEGTEYAPRLPGAKISVLRTVTAKPGVFSIIKNGMREAVVRGTARSAHVEGMNVCGKTGSPETEAYPEYRHGWFVGFAPYEKPEIVVVVFAEWGHGGSTAAPIARKVFKAYRDARYAYRIR